MLCQRICGSKALLNSIFTRKIIKPFGKITIHTLTNSNIKNDTIIRSAFLFVPKRNFFQFFKRPTKEQLRIRDDVPDQYTLIYRSRMDRYILYAQVATTVTALIAIISAMIKSDTSNNQLNFSDWQTPPRTVENEIHVYVIAFVVILVLLQVMVHQLPIRIYNLPEQKKYIFMFYGNYPFSLRRMVCYVGDVFPLPETGVLPWRQGRYLVKDKQKLILIDDYFRRPADLYVMLGVQTDPDEKEASNKK